MTCLLSNTASYCFFTALLLLIVIILSSLSVPLLFETRFGRQAQQQQQQLLLVEWLSSYNLFETTTTTSSAPPSQSNHDDDDDDFEKWMKDYNKTYKSKKELQRRRSIFYNNIHSTFVNRGVDAVFGMDEYTDLTSNEFVNLMTRNGCNSITPYFAKEEDSQQQQIDRDNHDMMMMHYYDPTELINISIDWRNHNNQAFVTPVKNQGPWGTCWSFGVAENLEGLSVRQGFGLVNISEQEFVSCCEECQGRKEEITLEWLRNTTGGIPALESSYPYDGNSSIPCAVDTADRARVQVHSWTRVFDQDGTGMAIVAALMQHGPMGMGVDASCFHGYKSGIIQSCNSTLLRHHGINHAVLLVGAGTDVRTGVDYFIIKNSWGTGFGEDGYVRIERGHSEWWGTLSTLYTE